MFKLKFAQNFIKKAKFFAKKDKDITQKILETTIKLSKNPKDKSLKSHKITRKNGAIAFTSRVTGDIRIIWDYHKNQAMILDIIDIGRHSGKDKVYK